MSGISRFFQNPGGSGGSNPPGVFTPGSVIFAAADGSLTENNPILFFDNNNNRLGIGTNSPSHTLHVRGSSPTTGTAFFVQNSTTEAFRVYNNRKIVAGGGSAATNTDFTFNALGNVSSSDFSFQIVGTNSGPSVDNTFRMSNAAGGTGGGAQIQRDSLIRRSALTFLAPSTTLIISSAGGIHYKQIQTYAEMQTNATDLGQVYAQGSNDSNLPGLIFNSDGSISNGFHFLGNRTWQTENYPFFSIRPLFSVTDNVGSTQTTTIFKIYPTYNFNGTSTFNVVGMDYNPTVTNITGTHYGLLVRTPSARNGFGLASTLPTALLHLAGSTASRASFRIESGTLPTGSDHKDGDLTYDGTDLNFRQGSTTKLLDFQPIQQTVNATTATTSIDLALGNVVILNLQTATTALTLTNIRVGTYIIIVKQDGTGGRLLTYTTTMNFAGGAAPTLTTTANYSDILTVVYDGTNIRTAVNQNFAV